MNGDPRDPAAPIAALVAWYGLAADLVARRAGELTEAQRLQVLRQAIVLAHALARAP